MDSKITKIWANPELYEEEEEDPGLEKEAPKPAPAAAVAQQKPENERKTAGEVVADMAMQEGRTEAVRAAAAGAAVASDGEKGELITQLEKLEGEIPNNEWGQAYHLLKNEIAGSPEMQNSAGAKAVLALLALAAKFSGYADMIPGHLYKSIQESTEQFSASDAGKMAAGNPGAAAGRMANLPQAKKEEYAALDIEAASTKYATYALWGVVGIDNASILAARLLHSKNHSEQPYYEPVGFQNIQASGLPYGSILIITYDIKTAEKVVAFATGRNGGKEIVYYHPKEGKKTFNIGDPDSPLKSMFALQLAFKPTGAEISGVLGGGAQETPVTLASATKALDAVKQNIEALVKESPTEFVDASYTNGRKAFMELAKVQKQIAGLDKQTFDKATADTLMPKVAEYKTLLESVSAYFAALKTLFDAKQAAYGEARFTSEKREGKEEGKITKQKRMLEQGIAALDKYRVETEAFLTKLGEIK